MLSNISSKSRHSLVFVLVVLFLFTLVQTVAAAPPPKYKSQYKSSGNGATAGWFTCTTSPMPGEICEDTYLDISSSRKGQGQVYFSKYRYTTDDQGYWQIIDYSYGYGPASIQIDNKLTKAVGSATLPILTCTVIIDPDGNWLENCQEAGTVSVQANWTGTGPLERSRYQYNYTSGGFSVKGQFRGTSRQADAQVLLNGQSLGNANYGGMYYNSSHEMTIQH